ncbi:MAG: LytR/AlgR family response regulator transcription factor, partial [Bacteroidota bacterium]
AERIKEHSMVIFTTAYKEYAIDAFDLNALDYLVKPFNRERFYNAVCKADEIKIAKEIREKQPRQSQDWDKSIVIKAEYKNIKLQLSDILFIEALDNYVKIHTPERTYVTLQNLKSISEVLDQKRFMRVHRSFIISLPKVDQYNSSKIHINGNEIPIGRTFLPEFRKSIKEKSVYKVN